MLATLMLQNIWRNAKILKGTFACTKQAHNMCWAIRYSSCKCISSGGGVVSVARRYVIDNCLHFRERVRVAEPQICQIIGARIQWTVFLQQGSDERSTSRDGALAIGNTSQFSGQCSCDRVNYRENCERMRSRMDRNRMLRRMARLQYTTSWGTTS